MSPTKAVEPLTAVPRQATAGRVGADLRSGAPDRFFAVAFEPAAARVANMRRITAAHLRLWRVPPSQADNVLLVLSELVTNAVVHGHGAVTLRVSCASGQWLRIEVKDGSPTPARRRCVTDNDESGRGLFLVDFYATEWGVSDNGTTTWWMVNLSEGTA